MNDSDEVRAAIARVLEAQKPARVVWATAALLDLLAEHLDHRLLATLRAELANAPASELQATVRSCADGLLAAMATQERDHRPTRGCP